MGKGFCQGCTVNLTLHLNCVTEGAYIDMSLTGVSGTPLNVFDLLFCTRFCTSTYLVVEGRVNGHRYCMHLKGEGGGKKEKLIR